MMKRELVGVAVVVGVYLLVRWYLTRLTTGSSSSRFSGGIWV